MPEELFEAALAYSARGWPVFPLRAAGKLPLTEHGFHDATTSLSQLAAWWDQWPEANVGLPTGDHFIVVDIDPRAGGDEALRELEATHGALPATWRVVTSSGGAHIYFQPVAGLRNSAGLLGPGLDVRGAGGYVVAPPSLNGTGGGWTWELGHEPDELPLAVMPEWLVERLLRPRGTGNAADDDEWVRRLSGVPLGQQNNTATQIAGRLAARGLTAGEIGEILVGFGARCEPPITREDAATFRDIARRIWAAEQAQRGAPAGNAPPVAENWPYTLDHGSISQERELRGRDGAVQLVRTPLARFDGWVTTDVTVDTGDGTPAHIFHVAGIAAPTDVAPATALSHVEIRAEEFTRLDWVYKSWGARALVMAASGSQRHHLGLAILTRAIPEQRTVYAHTGWRWLDGAWVYFHGAGALGRPDIRVQIDPAFRRFGLPAVVDPALARVGMQHILGPFRAAAPSRITTPLFSGLFLPPLIQWHDTPFTFLLTGPTGQGKSSMNALTFSGYGDFPDERSLQLGWSSTANYQEQSLFTFKDHPTCIDDVGQTGTIHETQAKYERIIRAQANRQDRGRMRADGTLSPRHPPRGLLFISAQTPPLDEALLARTYSIEFRDGDVDLSTPRGSGKPLDVAQNPDGLLAMRHAVAAYIAWLTPPDEEATQLRRRIAEIMRSSRPAAARGGHARLPETVATLLLGVQFGLDFAQHLGVLDAETVDTEWRQAATMLSTVSATQRADLADRRPARQYLGGLQSLLDARQVCLLPQSHRPDDHKPPPAMVGWYSDDAIYLDPHSGSEVFRRARERNEPLNVTEAQVMAELRDAGILQTGEAGRTRKLVKLGGHPRRVYALKRAALDDYLGVPFHPGDYQAGREPGDESTPF
jgi:hypothetical protein